MHVLTWLLPFLFIGVWSYKRFDQNDLEVSFRVSSIITLWPCTAISKNSILFLHRGVQDCIRRVGFDPRPPDTLNIVLALKIRTLLLQEGLEIVISYSNEISFTDKSTLDKAM